MENFKWKNVKLSVLGKQIDIESISYTNGKFPKSKKLRKLTNFQRKKLEKKFSKVFITIL